MPLNWNTLGWQSEKELLDAMAAEQGIDFRRLEREPVHLTGRTLVEQLRHAAPFIVRAGDQYLGVLRCDRSSARVLTANLAKRTIGLRELRNLIAAEVEAPLTAEVDRLVAACHVPPSRQERARTALLEERLSSRRLGTVWQVRAQPGSPFLAQMRTAGVLRMLSVMTGSHLLEYGFFLLGWWMIGNAALSGRIDWGWLSAWLLCLASMVPLRLLATWSQGVAGVALGGLLKQRLLAGAVQLSPDLTRRQGAGQILGCAIESEMIETLPVTGGLASALAVLELVISGAVLAMGSGGLFNLAILLVWIALSVWLGLGYLRRRREWTNTRLSMTHHLVERITGHRTRIAQCTPDRWHDGEDPELDRYLTQSAAMDRRGAVFSVVIPRGWLFVGLCGLGLSGGTSLALGLSGVLLAHQALQRLVAGAAQLTSAAIAWERVRILFNAAADQPNELSRPNLAPSDTVIQAEEIAYRYAQRAQPSIQSTSLTITRGDWVLLEGASGSGKSTLAAILAGLRRPDSGLLLAGGLDHATLGEAGWRRRVVAAPQFHENHIFSGSLAFNLLLGREWPPKAEDVRAAESICRDLGLADLLDRMPAGIDQMVGETGWQLSQGEKSRVFFARAILQNPDLIILDESFGALDPLTLRQSLECALQRAQTLLVVAHP